MRRAWAAVFVAVWLAASPAAQAAEWSITSFQAEIEINRDASIAVHETVAVNFFVNKHGIFREIPFRYPAESGSTVSVPIDIQRVALDGAPVPYETSRSGNQLSVKIGDPDRTITGTHQYEVFYTAEAAVNFFDDHDELYWNVTGTDWDVPLTSVAAVVHLPPGATAESVQATCYTGPLGSDERNCSIGVEPPLINLSAAEPLTAVVGWAPGVVIKPANYDELRSAAGQSSASNFFGQFGLPWIVVGNLALPLVVALFLFFWWKRHGHDPQTEPRTTVVQYDPPDKLTPGEIGVLFDERANPRDIIAIMIDLAVRGYLSITEVKNDRFLGLGTSTDYTLKRERPVADDASLQPHERQMLKALFADGSSVDLSDLKGKFHTHMRDISEQLYQTAVTKGYFVAHPDRARKKFLILGVMVLAGGLVVPFLFPGFLITGVLMLIFSRVMPKRTPKGVKALRHTRGFKEYLEKAEKYRLQWQEREHIFEQFLPYAMAFGVADQWSKAFADIAMQPPRWYYGTYDGGFNSLLLWSSLSSMHTQATQAFVPPAARGSSGFGGGGFSGGGFGGGGGGSW
ncbi:MAG: DUF2207 domain-containing protein [Candidatus Kerfeldbacteria bacterium]|nr:DUF2207 domain-containing protein [Candidatus Kerfeldbacteria bacterium]